MKYLTAIALALVVLSAHASPDDLTTKAVAAFHAQTGLQCPNAKLIVLGHDEDADAYTIDLRCDLGDVWQHFDIVSYPHNITVAIGDTVQK